MGMSAANPKNIQPYPEPLIIAQQILSNEDNKGLATLDRKLSNWSQELTIPTYYLPETGDPTFSLQEDQAHVTNGTALK